MDRVEPDNNDLTALQSLSGQIYVRQYNSEEEDFVCLYGDPEGLRSLAEKLTVIADLAQDLMQEQDLPTGEGFHAHFPLETRKSDDPTTLIVGRLDAKGDGNTSWFFRD